MTISKRALTWLIIIYVLVILVLSTALINTKVALNRTWVLHVRLDHMLHVLMFIPWMALVRCRWNEKEGMGFIILALVVGLLLASISEGVQLFIPKRAFYQTDLIANWLGIFVGGLIYGGLNQRNPE
jgi:hypothetical protein